MSHDREAAKTVVAPGEPLLVATGITKRFGGLAALDGVDVTIRRGEILGVLGPNGAGKTTFVNCISGLVKPTSGRIHFENEDITRLPGHEIGRRGIARTFQVVKPLRHLTVLENVSIGAMFGAGGRGRSAKQARRRAEEVLTRVGLLSRARDTAGVLTIPDLKRLELARALAMDPTLLFLDEVMAGLNPVEVESAMALLRQINRDGVTLFVIEHVMKAILGISDRIVVLHFGRKIAEGHPRDVVEDPRVVEAYLGERYAKRESAQPDAPRPGPLASGLVARGDARPAPHPGPLPPGEGELLQVRGVSSGYGGVRALWDVSLDVRPGELVALVGANGAGKTTLLLTISRLIDAFEGTIRFRGKDVTKASASEVVRAGLVHVPEGRRLFAGLTVRENLLQGAYPRRDAREIARDLERVFSLMPRLAERAEQPGGLLSGGEQQMCAIGRSLMARPRLLLIDELSLGLAPVVVDGLLELLSAIKREGTAVLMVEQDVQVALEHADRGYVMESGRLVQESPAQELLRDPRIRQAYLGL